MTKTNKIQFILNYIGKYYSEFEKQARVKLYKRRHLLSTDTDYLELVSDVIFTIVDKLDNVTYVNKFYTLCLQDELKLYIFKSIDRNCSSFTAPFLYNKLKLTKQNELNYDIQSDYKNLDSDQLKWVEYDDETKDKVNRLYEMLEYPKARELFGEHWKYFANLFLEYIDDKSTTYKSLSIKYDVPISSIGSHIKLVKDKLLNEYNKNKITL